MQTELQGLVDVDEELSRLLWAERGHARNNREERVTA